MPRHIVEELQGYRFGVGQREVPDVGADGVQLFDRHGVPKTRTEWVVELVDLQPTHAHVIRIPLTDEAKAELVRQLTGGVALASQIPPNGRP
jgi:hypothetical protein